MERHCSNAERVAVFLNNHPMVTKVNYPGLASHKDHDVASKQMRHPGPMMSFELNGGLEEGKKFINNLKMCTVLCRSELVTHSYRILLDDPLRRT